MLCRGANIPYISELLPLLFSPVSKVIFEKETSTSLKDFFEVVVSLYL